MLTDHKLKLRPNFRHPVTSGILVASHSVFSGDLPASFSIPSANLLGNSRRGPIALSKLDPMPKLDLDPLSGCNFIAPVIVISANLPLTHGRWQWLVGDNEEEEIKAAVEEGLATMKKGLAAVEATGKRRRQRPATVGDRSWQVWPTIGYGCTRTAVAENRGRGLDDCYGGNCRAGVRYRGLADR
ncbi:hypothetical protein B296_00011371 [Ensete ventricosum]|uniref:Uncharacterized protein n=1 Tax=Ensete ventricosum TaxID=4639 RepID=A0A426ZEN5_ENSVE|nr:hypothetical protein B296_00011371 [Ensete ventricosum]